MSKSSLHGHSQIAIDNNIHEPCGTFPSMISAGDSYARSKDMRDIYEVMVPRDQHSTISNQSSIQFAPGPHLANVRANILPVLEMANVNCSSLSSETSVQFRNRTFAANAEAQAVLPHDTQVLYNLLQSDPTSLNHSVSGYTLTKLGNESYTSSMVDRWLPSGIETKVFPSTNPAMSQSVIAHETLFQHFIGDNGLTSLTKPNGLHEIRSNVATCGTGRYSLHGVGLNNPLCSSTVRSVVEDKLSDYKFLSKGLSFGQEVPEALISKLPAIVAPALDMMLSESNQTNNLLQSNAQPQQMRYLPTASKNENFSGVYFASSFLNQGGDCSSTSSAHIPTRCIENSIAPSADSLGTICDGKVNSSGVPEQLSSEVDLFDGMELDLRHMFQGQGFLDDIFMPGENCDLQNLKIDFSEHTTEFDKDAISAHERGLFSELGLRHILDAIGDSKVDSSASHSSVITCVKSANNHELENQFSASSNVGDTPSSTNLQQTVLPPYSETTDLLLPKGNVEQIIQESTGQPSKCTIGPWIAEGYSMNVESTFVNQPKKPEELTKIPKKRARPGESTRPRPKDRQQIQDRVKELREIVPNGAKCSIDALLARTVNHMLFLQGVIKYADMIKQTDEPKMIGEETGVILRDSPSSGGGATWAYEVAGQTIVCPITVKELSPPGQMLIEILCEDRGSFLEIADSIRGFGLTILKGVMEARDKKIWAHFLVEANQEVTRMEIFLHLVQLLTKTSGFVSSNDHAAKVIDNGIPTFNNYQQSMPIPVSLGDRGW